MSKYTTEVRYICEVTSGLTDSLDFYDVDDILEKSWNKIFTTKAEIFDEEYRPYLCKKILKHFYLREICSETVGIWKLWLNTRMEELLPYYNQLYLSTKLKFDPFINTDLTTVVDEINTNEKNGTTNTIKTSNNVSTGESSFTDEETNKGTSKTDVNNNHKDKYSDTPQGALSDIEANKYLTNYRNTTDDNNTNVTTSNTVNKTNKNTNENTNKFDEQQNNTQNETQNGTTKNTTNVKGKTGSESYMKLLQEYRESLLNIDMKFIEDFDDLFFKLW